MTDINQERLVGVQVGLRSGPIDQGDRDGRTLRSVLVHAQVDFVIDLSHKKWYLAAGRLVQHSVEVALLGVEERFDAQSTERLLQVCTAGQLHPGKVNRGGSPGHSGDHRIELFGRELLLKVTNLRPRRVLGHQHVHGGGVVAVWKTDHFDAAGLVRVERQTLGQGHHVHLERGPTPRRSVREEITRSSGVRGELRHPRGLKVQRAGNDHVGLGGKLPVGDLADPTVGGLRDPLVDE